MTDYNMTLNIGRRVHQVRVHDTFIYPIGQGYNEMYEVLAIDHNLGVPQLTIYDSITRDESTQSLDAFEIELNRINDYLVEHNEGNFTIIPVASNPRAICIGGEYRVLKNNDLIRYQTESSVRVYEIINYRDSKCIDIRYKSHFAVVQLRDIQEDITSAECNGTITTHLPLDHMKRKMRRTRIHHYVSDMLGALDLESHT